MLKQVMNDVVMPAMREEVRLEVERAMQRDREFLWAQFTKERNRTLVNKMSDIMVMLMEPITQEKDSI